MKNELHLAFLTQEHLIKSLKRYFVYTNFTLIEVSNYNIGRMFPILNLKKYIEMAKLTTLIKRQKNNIFLIIAIPF